MASRMQAATFSSSLYAAMTTETLSMRATVSGLPPALRLAMGLMTVVAFAFFGFTMREAKPILGYALIALAAYRLWVWIGEVRWEFGSDDQEDAETADNAAALGCIGLRGATVDASKTTSTSFELSSPLPRRPGRSGRGVYVLGIDLLPKIQPFFSQVRWTAT